MASKTITKNIMSLDEFPVLGTNISKDQERNIRLSNVSTREEKVETIDKEEQVYKKHESTSNDSFLFTKPCKNVTDNTKEEEFGVCTRSVCTFAHSIEEFRIPKCRFTSNCRSSNCKFLHPDETTDEWTLRTGEKLPHLPLTNVSSRQPSDHVNSKDFDSHTDLPNISLPVYDPRFHDPHFQDPRFQDPRFQDPRFQYPQVHDPRFQYPQVHDTRVHDTRVYDTRVHDTRVYDTLFQNTQVYDHMIDNRTDKRPIQVPNSLIQNTIPQIVTKPKPYNKKFEIELQFLNSEGKLSYITVPTKELALIALQAGFDNGNNEVKMCKVYR